ncbi:MAG: glycine cleavage system protein H [Brevinematales bacterium]|nr:glycine cleavage system protein H [Brevinematales bacterium]
MTPLYSESHVWIRIDGSKATVGISKYISGMMGKPRYVELPDPGAKLDRNAKLCTLIAQIIPRFDVLAPLTGKVIEVNRRLTTFPEILHVDPEGDGWIARLEIATYIPRRLREELEAMMEGHAYHAWLLRKDKSSDKK